MWEFWASQHNEAVRVGERSVLPRVDDALDDIESDTDLRNGDEDVSTEDMVQETPTRVAVQAPPATRAEEIASLAEFQSTTGLTPVEDCVDLNLVALRHADAIATDAYFNEKATAAMIDVCEEKCWQALHTLFERTHRDGGYDLLAVAASGRSSSA